MKDLHIIGVDLSNTKDYSVMSKLRINHNSEIMRLEVEYVG